MNTHNHIYEICVFLNVVWEGGLQPGRPPPHLAAPMSKCVTCDEITVFLYISLSCLEDRYRHFKETVRNFGTCVPECISWYHHHHHHVHEGLGVFPVPWSSRWRCSLHLFLSHPMFLCHFGLYCSACFGILFVSILSTCCSHFFWYWENQLQQQQWLCRQILLPHPQRLRPHDPWAMQLKLQQMG